MLAWKKSRNSPFINNAVHGSVIKNSCPAIIYPLIGNTDIIYQFNAGSLLLLLTPGQLPREKLFLGNAMKTALISLKIKSKCVKNTRVAFNLHTLPHIKPISYTPTSFKVDQKYKSEQSPKRQFQQ